MKKYILGVAALLLTMNTSLLGQELREYIGTADRSEVILDTKGMPDGGAVMVGYSTVLNASNQYDYTQSDILALRVDATGNIMWNRRMGVAGLEDFLKSVIIADNGDIVAAGYVGHVPWGITSPTVGYGAIYRFDAATGATVGSNFVTNPTTNSNDKGTIFNSVIQLDNGDFVTAGGRDAQPGWSDGIVTCFDPTLNVVWSTTYLIPNTDEAAAVTQDNNRIFVGAGFYSSGSFYDLNLAELDPGTGTVLWAKRMAYVFNHPETGNPYTNNFIDEIDVVNNELYILTSSINDWAASGGGMSGILRTDLLGNFISLKYFDHPSLPFNNTSSVDYEDANTAYYVVNPGNTSTVFHAPVTGALNIYDADLGIVDPVGGTISDTRDLIHQGEQSLLSVNLSGINSYWGGTALNDPAQIGFFDVFYVKGENGLPHNHADCEAFDGNLVSDDVPVTEANFQYSIDPNWVTNIPNIIEHDDALGVVLLCEEEPCSVEDITFCSSWASPLTYTFDVTTDPPGSNVVWDFGDGSPTVGSTAGTPVIHTYATPGYYTVCVDVLDAAGDVCTTECIDICISDVTVSAGKPGKGDQATKMIPVKEESTIIGELYPNPTDGSLNIPVSTKLTSTDVNVRIIRMDGVVVHDTKTRIEHGKQILKVELSNITPGNYMCEIRDGETRSVKMFTKN